MGDFGDGRLELDELGAVIDRASSLDAPQRAELLEGNDATTWHERLETAGITPWLRRHRVAVAAGAVAALVLGSAGTAWVRSRPPEQITAVDVAVTDWVTDSNGSVGVIDMGAGTLQASYRAAPLRAGDSVRILGIVGPGIRASSVRPHSDAVAGDGSATADVAVVVGCDDPRLDTATVDAFALRVEETDAYGRSTTGTAPLPLGTAGQWRDLTVMPCAQQRVTELVVPTKVEISASLPTRTVVVDVTVHNGSGHDLALSPPQGQQTSVYAAGGIVVLGDGDDAVVPVRLRVTDCAAPRLDDAYAPDDGLGRSSSNAPGVNLFVTQNDLPEGFGATILARFTKAEQATVDALLRSICRGAPAASAHVLVAGSSPIDPDVEFTSNGDPSTVALRMTLDVATTAQHVTLSDGVAPEDLRNGAPLTLSPADAAVTRGHARLVVDWAVQCSGVVSPPVVQLVLTSGSRSWPVRATLADAHLLAAYRVACPGLQQREEFTGMGWPS